YVALTLVAVVLLNAAPEVIYQRGTYGGLATIQESVSFLQANWLEWLLPNLVLGGALYAVWAYMPLAGLVGLVATTALGGALLHVGMLFRGHLFGELVGSSHRQRMFRYRTG
ncbi:MAG TPA: hypothetical protein VEY30_13050, partial [Myxococcaceae bacterium]|nr:hypothetical protein [Myxococcaceae bacterium]